MIEKRFEAWNFIGFSVSRVEVDIVSISSRFRCDITLKCYGRHINMKSLDEVKTAGILSNSAFTIVCDGPDEKEAMDRISNDFRERFIVR